ncbi:hypothetical protein HPC49_25730 [Pyxidicoccus fallax]|uniref:Uncharacterized protein n=1 Tax=Pyxidicoccus fallax TaxID=394095 RepID=A0A848LSV5_9BACT|nr:immunity 49 family protein [Pyxidicoccus fallax]NMO20771.1 hypothetical protein [Pyxidicoccus fallax]NPC81608.1 hypothetical protein [Pyxidicoccus fallax]
MGLARSTSLEALRSNTAFALRDALARIESRAPEESIGYAYFDAAWRYRRLASCELLLEGQSDRFAGFLCKAALLQRHLQQLAFERHGIEPIHLCPSMTQGPVNALVAGDIRLALTTARGMPEHPLDGVEYEEDFLLYACMRALLLQSQDATAAADPFSILKRWTRVVANGGDPFLDVCSALAARAEPDFTQAFDALLEHRVAQCQQARLTKSVEDEQYQSEAFIFMKGLAFLRLAQLRGIETRAEYPRIPRFALLPLKAGRVPANSWRVPEQAMPAG